MHNLLQVMRLCSYFAPSGTSITFLDGIMVLSGNALVSRDFIALGRCQVYAMVCEWLLDRAGIQAPCFCSELLSRASSHMSIKCIFVRLGDTGFLCWLPFQRNSRPHSRFIPPVGVS